MRILPPDDAVAYPVLDEAEAGHGAGGREAFHGLLVGDEGAGGVAVRADGHQDVPLPQGRHQFDLGVDVLLRDKVENDSGELPPYGHELVPDRQGCRGGVQDQQDAFYFWKEGDRRLDRLRATGQEILGDAGHEQGTCPAVVVEVVDPGEDQRDAPFQAPVALFHEIPGGVVRRDDQIQRMIAVEGHEVCSGQFPFLGEAAVVEVEDAEFRRVCPQAFGERVTDARELCLSPGEALVVGIDDKHVEASGGSLRGEDGRGHRKRERHRKQRPEQPRTYAVLPHFLKW